jgi:hypothetical protein
MSNEHTPLMTVTDDEVGRHDTVGGACSKESNTLRYGHHTWSQHACVDNFLAEGARYGLGKRDLVSNINWYMNVPVEKDGTLGIVDGLSAPGLKLTLRAERDVLVLVSNCPQINNPCNGFEPTAVEMTITEAAVRRSEGCRMTFDTLLIANRGEIAVRIIRTARELGLRTVAVYSDADRSAPTYGSPTRRYDSARHPPKSRTWTPTWCSRRPRTRARARSTPATASSPRTRPSPAAARTPESCSSDRLPHSWSCSAPSTRHGRRPRRRESNWHPGTGLLADLDEALAQAALIGYPVMLKATGGGGGIGMSACHSPAELTESWERVQRVAAASFSSAGVFLERLVEHARHVEVQVFGDGEGKVVTFGDRDCSLQRRNQKVVEEAPAPGLPDHIRTQLATSARDLCASVGYRSAGTVEFVYDATREEAYFLEVNTRLQVEHPVTEEVYGVDLVAWMLRLAQGETDVVRDPAPRAATPSRPASTPRTRPANTGPARAC